MSKKLILTADSYDVLRDPKDASKGTEKTLARGDSFVPYSDDEAERLVSSGAAVDPDKQREDELAELDRRRAVLEAERDRIEGDLSSLTPPEDLKGKQLDEALAAAGLSAEGSADEKRARLAAHQSGA